MQCGKSSPERRPRVEFIGLQKRRAQWMSHNGLYRVGVSYARLDRLGDLPIFSATHPATASRLLFIPLFVAVIAGESLDKGTGVSYRPFAYFDRFLGPRFGAAGGALGGAARFTAQTSRFVAEMLDAALSLAQGLGHGAVGLCGRGGQDGQQETSGQ